MHLKIGTRGSKLALKQAQIVQNMLKAAWPKAGFIQKSELVPLSTKGDTLKTQPLSEIGGNGLFTREIERALLEGEVDIAVHSLKDMASTLLQGTVLACVLEREDPHDVFISLQAKSLCDLAPGSRVGTSSPRRQAQILSIRPDLKVVSFRGNVDTRLKKLEAGEVEATILAYAGLKRLEKEDVIQEILPFETMLPAVAQGALGVQMRENENEIHSFLAPLNHKETEVCILAERSLLRQMDGSCKIPLAGLATLKENLLTLEGLLANPEGERVERIKMQAPRNEALRLGEKVAEELLRLWQLSS